MKSQIFGNFLPKDVHFLKILVTTLYFICFFSLPFFLGKDSFGKKKLWIFTTLVLTHPPLKVVKGRFFFTPWPKKNYGQITLSCIKHDYLCFPSFFGPLESSLFPSSCFIFFPWLSGFYRVVNHIWGWS